MTSTRGPEIRLNGVRYRWPDRPVVVVCNDGGDPAYFDRALKDGIIPNVARFMETADEGYSDQQNTDTIVSFRINQANGTPTPTGQVIKTNSPCTIVFASV